MIPIEEKTDETEEIKNLAVELDATRNQMQKAINWGANWFFIIAVLSVINFFFSPFVVNYGVSKIIEKQYQPSVPVLFLLNLCISVLFAAFGVCARKKYLWGFIAGMILYGLDAIGLLSMKDFWGFAFHLLILFLIFRGVRALRVFEKIEQKGYFQPPSL